MSEITVIFLLLKYFLIFVCKYRGGLIDFENKLFYVYGENNNT